MEKNFIMKPHNWELISRFLSFITQILPFEKNCAGHSNITILIFTKTFSDMLNYYMYIRDEDPPTIHHRVDMDRKQFSKCYNSNG